jgi:hypothetical protein
MNVQNTWRPILAGAMAVTFVVLAGLAQAVEFDQKLKAPAMKDAGELRSQAQSFASRFGEVRAATPDQLIRDATLTRKRFDLTWQIQRAIDERKPLDELASIGIVARGDGSYSVDMGEHPEWYYLHETMAGMLVRADLDAIGPALIARGFRPEDLAILKDYVATHNPTKAAANEMQSVVIGFGRSIRRLDSLKRTVPDNTITSYFYQRARAASESDRRWVEGLLQRLDAQRGRILLSIFTEMKPTALWIPEDWSDTAASLMFQARQPGFEARIAAEAKGVAP